MPISSEEFFDKVSRFIEKVEKFTTNQNTVLNKTSDIVNKIDKKNKSEMLRDEKGRFTKKKDPISDLKKEVLKTNDILNSIKGKVKKAGKSILDFLFDPKMLAVAGIVGGVIALVRNFPAVIKTIQGAWDYLSKKLPELLTSIGDIGKALWPLAKSIAKFATDEMVNYIKLISNAVVSIEDYINAKRDSERVKGSVNTSLANPDLKKNFFKGQELGPIKEKRMTELMAEKLSLEQERNMRSQESFWDMAIRGFKDAMSGNKPKDLDAMISQKQKELDDARGFRQYNTNEFPETGAKKSRSEMDEAITKVSEAFKPKKIAEDLIIQASQIADTLAAKYPNVSKALLLSTLDTESAGKGNSTSPKDAFGYTQIMPGTQASIEQGIGRKLNLTNLADALEGTAYLYEEAFKKYKGQGYDNEAAKRLAIADYLGPLAVNEYKAGKVTGRKVDTISTTEQYVGNIEGGMKHYGKLNQNAANSPSPQPAGTENDPSIVQLAADSIKTLSKSIADSVQTSMKGLQKSPTLSFNTGSGN